MSVCELSSINVIPLITYIFSDNYVCVFGVGVGVITIPHPPRIFRRLALLLVHLRL